MVFVLILTERAVEVFVPRPLQSVQRAEMWSVIFGLADLSCCSPWC